MLMEWYWIVLIAYGAYIFILWLFLYTESTFKPFKLGNLLSVGIFTLLVLIICTPSILLWNMTSPYEVYGMWQYRTYFTYPLSENTKTTLITLGFELVVNEKDYISGLRFNGYTKKSKGDFIIVQDNGEISVRYTNFIARDTKHLVEIIKAFPKKEVEEAPKNENAS